MMFRSLIIVFLAVTNLVTLQGQKIQLLKEINPTNTLGSFPQYSSTYLVNNGILYFLADDGSKGVEVWRTDGTTAGTYLLKDIAPGNKALYSVNFSALGTKVIIGAEYNSVYNVYISDGTVDGTILLKSLGKTASGEEMVTVGDNVYFKAYSSLTNNCLWKTDGTIAGTIPVVDNQGKYVYDPKTLSEHNGILYFLGIVANQGDNLWRSNGQGDGTYPIKILDPNNTNVLLVSRIVSTPIGAFFDVDKSTKPEIWITDGTTNGTHIVKDSVSYYLTNRIPSFAYLNGKFYFKSENAELWSTDGTSAGTKLVKNIYPNNIYDGIVRMDTFQSKLIFTSEQSSKEQLWVSDGTNQGTQRITTFNSNKVNSNTVPFAKYGNDLFLVGNANFQNELWKTDGTTAALAYDFDLNYSSDPRDLVVLGDKIIFFAGFNGTNTELYYYLDPLVSSSVPNGNAEQFKVYPNPAHDHFTISKDITLDENTPIRLIGPDGRLVQQWLQAATDRQFSIPSLPKGLYVVTGRAKAGNTITSKIIIE